MKSYQNKPVSESAKLPNISKVREDDHFKLLRPSKELLYYRRKIMHLTKEYQEMDAKVEKCVNICDKYSQMNLENQKRQCEVTQLQDTVSDLQVHLYQEREQVLRLYAENDRLKIRALQDRKKINYLLSLTSTSEKELNLICSRPWRTIVPQKGTSATKTTLTSEVSAHSSGEVDVESLILQNKALTSQLEEQTRLFQDNFHTLLRDRELQREEASTQFERSQETISRLSSELNETQKKLCDTVKEMLLLKEEHLKNELKWMTQRDMFLSSIQKYDAHCTLFDTNVVGDGSRSGGEKNNKTCELRVLKDEINQRDQIIAMYQEQCALLEEQISSLKTQLEICKVHCKDHIEKLQHTVSVLKQKNNALDQRRKLESEGFRSDVRLLRGRLQEVERTLAKLTRNSTIKVDQDLLSSAMDTASKAKLLEKELSLIKKKMAEMNIKLSA